MAAFPLTLVLDDAIRVALSGRHADGGGALISLAIAFPAAWAGAVRAGQLGNADRWRSAGIGFALAAIPPALITSAIYGVFCLGQ